MSTAKCSKLLFLWVLVFVSWWVWRNWQYIVLTWKVGTYYPIPPIIGHTYLVRDNETNFRTLLNISEHAIRNGGHSVGWILDRFYIILADAADAEYIMKNHLEKCDMNAAFRVYFRSSLVFAPVPQWRPRRKMIIPLLSHKNVSKFEPVFASASQTLVQRLRPLADGGVFPIWKHFSSYTVEATCNTILGMEVTTQSTVENLRKALTGIAEKLAVLLVSTILHLDWLVKRTRFYDTFKKHDGFVKKCVEEALEKLEKDTPISSDALDEEEDSSLLHMFKRLKKQRGIDKTLLHDETLGLMGASSDTTAVALSIVCSVLAQKQDVQEKIYQELKEVFGASDRPVTVEDFPRLKYMEVTIKETMRLYPTVPQITRKLLVDTKLPSGLAVPKGTNFYISIYALNRNPKYWGADADQFRPERFLGRDPEQATFFAFSHGPRGCPGSHYAMVSIKIALASLLRQYRLLPAASDAPMRMQFGITATAADEYPVRIEARQ